MRVVFTTPQAHLHKNAKHVLNHLIPTLAKLFDC